MKKQTKEQLKILSISSIACVVVAGISFAIVKIAVSLSIPLIWSVGETGISQAIIIIGGIVAIAGISIVAIVALGGFLVIGNLILPEEEDM
jgi:hypothetical protein